MCAAASSRMGSPQHEALQPIRHFLYRHMHEETETTHESWVLNDLQAIGVEPAASRRHAPSIHTLALTGYNDWAADRRHPCTVLGLSYALEVIASVYGGPFASAIRERLLLQGSAGVSFIESHATMDTQHMADLRVVLNHVQSAESRAAVIESARVNFHHFTRIIEAV